MNRRAFLTTCLGVLAAPLVADADQVMPAPQGLRIVRKAGTNEWWIWSTTGNVRWIDLTESIRRVYKDYAKGKQGIKVILANIKLLGP